MHVLAHVHMHMLTCNTVKYLQLAYESLRPPSCACGAAPCSVAFWFIETVNKSSAAAIRSAMRQSPVTRGLSRALNVSPSQRFRHAFSISGDKPSSFPAAAAEGNASAPPAQQVCRRSATWTALTATRTALTARGISLKASNLPVARWLQPKAKLPDSRSPVSFESCNSRAEGPACEPAGPSVQMPEMVSADGSEDGVSMIVSGALARARGQSPAAPTSSSISGEAHTNESMAEGVRPQQARWLMNQLSNARRLGEASMSEGSLPAENEAHTTCQKTASSDLRI